MEEDSKLEKERSNNRIVSINLFTVPSDEELVPPLFEEEDDLYDPLEELPESSPPHSPLFPSQGSSDLSVFHTSSDPSSQVPSELPASQGLSMMSSQTSPQDVSNPTTSSQALPNSSLSSQASSISTSSSQASSDLSTLSQASSSQSRRSIPVSFACKQHGLIPVKEKKRPRKPSPLRTRRRSSEVQLDDFFSNGCHCEKKCFKLFDKEYYNDTRNEAKALTRDELDMLLMAFVSVEQVVGPSHKHAPKTRERAMVKTFYHHGKPICRDTFLALHGIGNSPY